MSQITKKMTREETPVHIIATRKGVTKSREIKKSQRYVTFI